MVDQFHLERKQENQRNGQLNLLYQEEQKTNNTLFIYHTVIHDEIAQKMILCQRKTSQESNCNDSFWR